MEGKVTRDRSERETHWLRAPDSLAIKRGYKSLQCNEGTCGDGAHGTLGA